MTDTPSGAPEQQPLQFYQGQPISREAAATKRAELLAQPEYAKAFDNNDQARLVELKDLWMLERGHQPASPQPQDSADVAVQMSDRATQLSQMRVETWGQFISGFDDVKRATIARNLATQEQHDQARLEIRRMIGDPEFGRKVLAGDMDAKDRWARWNLIAAMRVAPADYDWSKDQSK